MSSFFTAHQLELEFFFRIVLSSLCGALIGFERTKRFKEAGVRTHCVVACGAALVMVVSKYGFFDTMTSSGEYLFALKGADPSRIAAQVVSGIGFLGAGVIFRTGTSVKGLTTAAGIWATSAVGLSLGAGMYLVGGLTTALIVIVQYLMHWLPFGQDAYVTQEICLRLRGTEEAKEEIFSLLELRGATISSCSGKQLEDGGQFFRLIIRVKKPVQVQELQQLMERYDIMEFSI